MPTGSPMSDAVTATAAREVPPFAPAQLRRFAELGFGRFAQELGKFPPAAIACRAGCSYCCRALAVSVSLPEIFLLKHHIDSLPPEESAPIRQRVAAANAQTRGHTNRERLAQHEPCPLLVDQRCSVYDVRPVSCRAAVSVDAEACRRAYEGERVSIGIPSGYMDALKSTSLMLLAAMSAANLECRTYELNAALDIALQEHDVEQRWMAGEDLFATAERR